jgi:predicted RNase H-like HicB family nuclease
MVAHSQERAAQANVVSAESLHYSLIVEWDPRDSVYVVNVPELPGCRTHGTTYAEAIVMAQSAIEVWVTGALQDGWDLPTPRYYADPD